MRFVVITGPSGAGKTLALHSLEDVGYFAADNLPPRLLPALVDFCVQEGYRRGAVVIDMRSGPSFAELTEVVNAIRERGENVEILYLDAGDEVLIHRYKETRRPHPLINTVQETVKDVGIVEAVQTERNLLESARALADSVLDTSDMTAVQLRDTIQSSYAADARPGLRVTVASFGFKYGLPIDADLVFDVRFLRNPHYVSELKGLDGRDGRVASYVHEDPLTAPFMAKVQDLIAYALPEYRREGKSYLTIAIGCTGGKHRSVTLAIDLAQYLEQAGHSVVVRHRDVVRNRANDIAEMEMEKRQKELRSVHASEIIPPGDAVVKTETEHAGPGSDGDNGVHANDHAPTALPEAGPDDTGTSTVETLAGDRPC